MFILVLLSGDVEPNPGPGSVVDNINSIHNGSLEMLTNHLSILHLNIQSLLPKLDLIAAESEAYDLLIFSESWLKPEIKSDSIGLTNFHSPFRRDRCDRPGGGVVIYVQDNIYCKRRSDLELQGLEAVWIELSIKSKKLLIGGCYRPPNSNAAYFDLLSESIDRAYNTNIIDIFILGDFNYNLQNNNVNKMTELIQGYSLTQLITKDTHYTENSSSLTDLILARNKTHVFTSGVIDTFIPNQIRYHCPTIVPLKSLRPVSKTYTRRIWNNKLADFDKFRSSLTEYNLTAKVEKTTDLDINAHQITDSLIYAAEKFIPNEVVTIRPSESPWITSKVKKAYT